MMVVDRTALNGLKITIVLIILFTITDSDTGLAIIITGSLSIASID